MDVAVQFLNNFLVRVLAISLTTALVSAGAIWFVVDVALRGVELAVQTTNARITELGVDVRSVKEQLPEVEKSIQALSHKIPEDIDDKLDYIASSVNSISSGTIAQLCSNDVLLYNSMIATQKTFEEITKRVSNVDDVALIMNDIGSIHSEQLDEQGKRTDGGNWSFQVACRDLVKPK